MLLSALSATTETLPYVAEIVEQSNLPTIDWNEVVLLVIGAAIGLVASLATTVIQNHLDQKGKLNIFYKFITPKGAKQPGWGFRNRGDGHIYFSVPVVFELQNTSNTTRVIRDVSLLLYRNNQLIGKMAQIEYWESTMRVNGEITKKSEFYYGGDNSSYSFVLSPRSIQKQKCHYSYKICPSEKVDKTFDRVLIRYHDERNKAHYFIVKDICGNWEEQTFAPDTEWFLLNCKKETARKYEVKT